MSAPALELSDLQPVLAAFALPGPCESAAPYGTGHINDTYLVACAAPGAPARFVLQRVNHRIFKDVPALMDNFARVTRHMAAQLPPRWSGEASRRVLTLVPTREGATFHRDAAGNFWRCCVYVSGATSHDVIQRPEQARAAAAAFGEFQRQLVNLPGGRLHETIPFFHHTRRRFDALERAIAADASGRRAEVQPEIDFARARAASVDVLVDLQARGVIPERITHNDTKLNNVLLDDTTGEGVCVIDLDTVMPGLALYDFGDMVRTATNSAAEDETDLTRVTARLPIFTALAEGYLASAGRFLNEAEIGHLVFAGRLMTFEVGIRFLTDFLEGDVYFKTKHPRHNRDRARNQFALLSSLEAQAEAMEAVVARSARQ